MKDIILGAGITGRILKYFYPFALNYESGQPKIHLNSSVGANYVWTRLEGFESRKVKVLTTVDHYEPTYESIRRYKNKVGKANENEEDWKEQFNAVQYGHIIVHEVLAAMYGVKATKIDRQNKVVVFDNGHIEQYDRLFSTIPLPSLMALVGEIIPAETVFKYRPIYVKTEPVKLFEEDIFRVNYVSSPCSQTYRETIRYGEKHSESLTPYVGEYRTLYPGKIWNSPAVAPMLEALAKFDIHCFGRYACWNSDELVHQTYQKIKQFKLERNT